ncbi:MAG TPA: hypothetical protein VMS09_20160 [Paenibacillus sp.]|uniref:hypothetical protein n=1 Tax=Paenibacillus sp. TaxID=58172 RepID=UPI002BDD1EE7|nr:hypothetical protein [Paenibacillus sp.]HUC94298.1 hypothetical protein [Paenibacillus sp.]
MYANQKNHDGHLGGCADPFHYRLFGRTITGGTHYLFTLMNNNGGGIFTEDDAVKSTGFPIIFYCRPWY